MTLVGVSVSLTECPIWAEQGRKYLDYDLEALYAHLRPHESRQVTVAFQDSEGFDTGLLSDLITLFK